MRISMKATPRNERVNTRAVRIASLVRREKEKAAKAKTDEKIHRLHVMIIDVEGRVTSAMGDANRLHELPKLSSTLCQLRAELRRARKGE